MRQTHSYGFLALRTPFLPLDSLRQWADDLTCASHPDDADRWARDRETALERLRRLLDSPVVREAIFLASPDLDEVIDGWRERVAHSPRESETDARVVRALVKYLYRMGSRCTPFGLFAGNSAGQVGSAATQLTLSDPPCAHRHTRLDTEILDQIVAQLADAPETRRHLAFTDNSSICAVGDMLRYAEPRTVSGRRAYFLVDVEPHEHLLRALERARPGAHLDQIADAIADDEVSFEAAREFVDQLVDAKMLVPDLGPVITGTESTDALVSGLASIPSARATEERLTTVRDALRDMDRRGPGVPPGDYRALLESVRTLTPVDPAHFVQLDLVRSASSCSVGRSTVEELLSATQVLIDLFAHGHTDPLSEFRRAFEERYGERAVALPEALDEELGIGFQASSAPGADASPLIAGLPFPPPEEEERLSWGSRARFLSYRVSEAIATGSEELVLDPAELAPFHDPTGPALAESFHIHATLLHGENDEQASATPVAVLESAGGPSGARLLGRFCHGDADLLAAVRSHVQEEEALHPEVRYFEVVHLPEGRTGNILARPLLRSLELEFLGRSGAPPESRLRIDDLTVSLEGTRIVIRSRKLGCEVRPRLTSAHNPRWRSLGLYRFLCALQADGFVEGVLWSWGPLESQPRLPRVRLGRIVLARQQWNVPRSEIRSLSASRGHDGFRAVQAWRTQRKLPRWIGLADQDNVLTVDLDHPLSIAAFVHALSQRDGATVQEVFPGARPDVVEGPGGRYVNEIVVPVVRHPSEPRATHPAPAPAPDPAHASGLRQRGSHSREVPETFPPGSEWLTLKLYTGIATSDRLLQELILPWVDDGRRSGAVHRWFYLRYADPDWHLRVRLDGDPVRLLTEVLPALHAGVDPWLADRRVHRVTVDTYVRETRRYGGPEAIEAAESVFFHDSETCASFIACAPGDDGLDLRWRFALVAMDRMLHDLGYELAARHRLTARMAEAYSA
ncbi:MAG: lantibiotic dehydratase, partial [Candidatus Eisenbacteria bacterium]|nr:lantibiotic dehydratase [Candidatus Eisenbacteria bacterium]